MDEKIKQLEVWRDWLWQMSLKARDLQHKVGLGMSESFELQAHTANRAMDIAKGNLEDKSILTIQDGVPGYEHYKYGEYPK